MGRRNINLPVTPSVLLCFILMPAIGNALDLTLEPRIQAGVMDYEFAKGPVKVKVKVKGSS